MACVDDSDGVVMYDECFLRLDYLFAALCVRWDSDTQRERRITTVGRVMDPSVCHFIVQVVPNILRFTKKQITFADN